MSKDEHKKVCARCGGTGHLVDFHANGFYSYPIRGYAGNFVRHCPECGGKGRKPKVCQSKSR